MQNSCRPNTLIPPPTHTQTKEEDTLSRAWYNQGQ